MKGLKTVYKTYNGIKPAKQGWGGGGGLFIAEHHKSRSSGSNINHHLKLW